MTRTMCNALAPTPTCSQEYSYTSHGFSVCRRPSIPKVSIPCPVAILEGLAVKLCTSNHLVPANCTSVDQYSSRRIETIDQVPKQAPRDRMPMQWPLGDSAWARYNVSIVDIYPICPASTGYMEAKSSSQSGNECGRLASGFRNLWQPSLPRAAC